MLLSLQVLWRKIVLDGGMRIIKLLMLSTILPFCQKHKEQTKDVNGQKIKIRWNPQGIKTIKHVLLKDTRNKRKSPKKWKTKLFGWFFYQVLNYKSNILWWFLSGLVLYNCFCLRLSYKMQKIYIDSKRKIFIKNHKFIINFIIFINFGWEYI